MIQPSGEALGAVRFGKQWRIALPKSFSGDSEWAWEMHARHRLKKIGVHLKPSWEIEFDKLDKQSDRHRLETYRFWLAAQLGLLERDAITREHLAPIQLLLNAAGEILGSLSEAAEVEKLKSKFPDQLRKLDFSEDKINFIMSYWPEPDFFQRVRAAGTLEQLEKIRDGMDTVQAIKTCKNLGINPTAKNLLAYKHKDFTTHINNWLEQMPGIVFHYPTPNELHMITMVSVQDQIHGKPPAITSIDLSKKGLALRTGRNRDSLKKLSLKKFRAPVCDVQDSIPGVDEKLHTGKTPAHSSGTRIL